MPGQQKDNGDAWQAKEGTILTFSVECYLLGNAAMHFPLNNSSKIEREKLGRKNVFHTVVWHLVLCSSNTEKVKT